MLPLEGVIEFGVRVGSAGHSGCCRLGAARRNDARSTRRHSRLPARKPKQMPCEARGSCAKRPRSLPKGVDVLVATFSGPAVRGWTDFRDTSARRWLNQSGRPAGTRTAERDTAYSAWFDINPSSSGVGAGLAGKRKHSGARD